MVIYGEQSSANFVLGAVVRQRMQASFNQFTKIQKNWRQKTGTNRQLSCSDQHFKCFVFPFEWWGGAVEEGVVVFSVLDSWVLV